MSRNEKVEAPAFAIFGAALLVVIIVQSSPSVTLENISKMLPTGPGTEMSGGIENTQRVSFRGDAQDSIVAKAHEGNDYRQQQDIANAERAYREAIEQMADPLNEMAVLYIESNRKREALDLARLVTQMRPTSLDTHRRYI